MIQVINGIKESISNINPNASQGTLADADPIALIALGACVVLAAALVVFYVVFGKENRR